MNLELSTSEVLYQAEEQVEENKKRMDRHDVRQAIADDYIRVMNADALEGDNSLLNSLIMGEGIFPVNKMRSDESLVDEYKKLFGEDIIIND